MSEKLNLVVAYVVRGCEGHVHGWYLVLSSKTIEDVSGQEKERRSDRFRRVIKSPLWIV